MRAPDWILVGRSAWTGDPERPRAEAVAVRQGRIAAVGDRTEIEALAGDRTRIDVVADGVILPGLADAHGHVLSLGFSLRRLTLRDTPSYEDLIRRAAAQAGRQRPGTWILGGGWDESRWTSTTPVRHAPLSAAVPDHPVLLWRNDRHAALANAAALRLAGIDVGVPDPPGGRILRDAAGDPTGVLVDSAVSLVEEMVTVPTRGEQLDALEEALRHLVSLGLTAVHDAGVGHDPAAGLADNSDPGWIAVDLYRELLRRGRLPLRVYVMLGGSTALPPEESFFAHPPVIGAGDGRLTVRTIKVGIDGALGSRGAALEADYSDEPGNRGSATRDQEALNRLVRRAFQEGWQVAIHAIGDRGNRMALDAIAAARAAVPGAADPRPRVEHAQVLRSEDLARFAELGVVASIQPAHAVSDHRWAEARLGSHRLTGAYAYRSLAAAGALLACGSDFPVESADPLAGLQAAVARVDREGRPPGGWRPGEALEIDQALRCFTAGPAYAAFQEDSSGRLAPGRWADLTVLDRDPTEVPPAELTAVNVLMTVVGGRISYDGRRDD